MTLVFVKTIWALEYSSPEKKKKDSMGIFVGLNEILSVKWLIFNWQF